MKEYPTTQAQIEAIAYRIINAPCETARDDAIDELEAALTAAAQVGEPSIDEKLEQWDEWYKTLPPALKTKLSISDFRRLGDNFYRIFVLQKPAAQAGDHSGVDHDDGHGWARMVEAMKLSTIERCAQVAADFDSDCVDSREIAAAIRKLKDAP